MASTTMALARAFTKRAKRNQDPISPSRGLSMRYPAGTIDRNLISLPTELISTTNMHALNAPDIASLNTSSGASYDGGSDSDFSHIDRSFLNTPVLSPDTASIDSSPITPITPSDNELKDFFADATPKRPATAVHIESADSSPSLVAPMIPKRAPSHSKKAHVELSRKRSIQRMSPPPNQISRPPSRQAAESADHPFRKELAQVNEIAEEFGLASSVLDEEEQEMMRKGLKKFDAQDYLDEIAELWGGVFEDQLGSLAKPWI